jgi:osmotically-inducible protein OsmY
MSESIPAYLVQAIREALATDERTNELELDVSVAGERVLVTGPVVTEERRIAVGEVVAEVADGYEVVNGTEVLAAEPATDAEQLP